MQLLLLRVAVRCGFPTVRHLLERYDITSPELNDLVVLDRIDPPLGIRSDHQVAMLAAVIANSAMGSKGRNQARDFLPEWGGRREMSNDDIKNIFRAIG